MTKQDYVLLANALNAAWHKADRGDIRGVGIAMEHVAKALQDDNPRFNRALFVQAVVGDRPTPVKR